MDFYLRNKRPATHRWILRELLYRRVKYGFLFLRSVAFISNIFLLLSSNYSHVRFLIYFFLTIIVFLLLRKIKNATAINILIVAVIIVIEGLGLYRG